MTSWSSQNKNTNSYTNVTQPSAPSWTDGQKSVGANDFLLKEDNGYILLETGDKIILEQSNPTTAVWSNQSIS